MSKNNVKWIIEDDCFPEDTQPMLDALDKNNLEYSLVKYEHYSDDISNCLDLYPPDNCVIFYGSLRTAQKLRKRSQWIPGVYYNKYAYECVNYYAKLGKYLLNGNYIILPFGELKRQKEFLYEKLGAERTIFLRPNRGDKTFTGLAIYKERFDQEVDGLNFNQIDPTELVIAAEPRNLKYEWRFVVVDGVVITGSQYKENDRVAIAEGYPDGAFDFASKIAKNYSPDRAFIIDVCQTKDDKYHIMEVGCFSCAGLYKCDRDVIVREVSRVAWEEWMEYQYYV